MPFSIFYNIPSGAAKPAQNEDAVPYGKAKQPQTITEPYRLQAGNEKRPENANGAPGRTAEPTPREIQKPPASNTDWIPVYGCLKSEITIRHYSPKTLRAYTSWARHLQAFTSSKDPRLLTSADVKEFLSYLAVTCNCPT
jgi:hypothetical protein